MFRNREDAGRQLAERLKHRHFCRPLVLAIPRGGVPVGVVLAEELNAELDIVLSRKLRSPIQPELAVGAVSEGGEVYLTPKVAYGMTAQYLTEEKKHQLMEISRRKEMFRRVRPQANTTGRSVIVTDDGIATGATMIAALQLLRAQSPHELLVAVPVASLDRLCEVRLWCDDVECLLAPAEFFAIGQFYDDFRQVQDEEVAALLQARYTQTETDRVPIQKVALRKSHSKELPVNARPAHRPISKG